MYIPFLWPTIFRGPAVREDGFRTVLFPDWDAGYKSVVHLEQNFFCPPLSEWTYRHRNIHHTMTNATTTFINSDKSNPIVLTIASANPPIIGVSVDSGYPYTTTKALDLSQTYSLQLEKQSMVKTVS